MANEFVHSSQGTTLTQAEFEAVGLHVFNSQAIGDILYATSSTQLSRLAAGSANSFLQVSSGVPVWITAPTLGGNLSCASYTITGTNEQYSIGDNSHYMLNIFARNISGLAGVDLQTGGTGFLTTQNTDDNYFILKARDNGSGLLEVARVGGAADPFFGVGNAGNVIKGTAGGLLGFYNASPVAQQTASAHNNWASSGDIASALISLGLFTS